MGFDPEDPVIALCAAGMAAEGVLAEARMKLSTDDRSSHCAAPCADLSLRGSYAAT
jgi:hypothetical protein